MIVKALTTDGDFILWDNVKSGIRFTYKDKFYAEPPLTVTEDDDPSQLEKWIENTVSGKEKSGIPKPENPCYLNASLGLRAEDMPERRRIFFFGKITGSERFCYKLITFIRDNVEYWLYTENPVYICSDEGKTIETIK